MMYMWNGFTMIRKCPELTDGMMQTLVEAERTLAATPGTAGHYMLSGASSGASSGSSANSSSSFSSESSLQVYPYLEF